MIRRLDPDKDVDLYRQAWGWREQYPRSLREATKVHSVETFEEFLELSRGARADIGVFEEEFLAVISVQWHSEGIFEIHFSSKRGTRVEQLIEPCLNIQKTIFENLNAKLIFAFTPEWNRSVLLLGQALGLQPTGVTKLFGTTSRGRVIVWAQLAQTREAYESDAKTTANADGHEYDESDVHAGEQYARHQSAA